MVTESSRSLRQCLYLCTSKASKLSTSPRGRSRCRHFRPRSIRQHTSAYVSMRQHTRSIRQLKPAYVRVPALVEEAVVNTSVRELDAPVPTCQHTSAYVSIRQHTPAYASIAYANLMRPCPPVSKRQHTSAYVSIRQHTSAYVSIRQHTSA